MIELLRRFLGPYGAKTIIGVLTKAVEVVFEVLTPLVVARMIDRGVRTGDVREVIREGLLLLLFAAVSYSFTFICQRLAAQVSQGMGTDVRNALYAQVNELSTVDLDRFGAPSLVMRITNDVNQVQLAVALSIRTLTRWPLLAVGSMAAALSIDFRLGLVFLVCMPVIGVVFARVMGASVPYFRAMQARLDRISLVTREALSGMRVIRAFLQEDREEERGRAAMCDHADAAVSVGRLSAVLNPVTFLVMYLGVAVILRQGGYRVDAGELTVGQIMALVSYMSQALVAVTTMTNLVVILTRAQTSSVRIMEVLDCVPSVTDKGNKPVDPACITRSDLAIELGGVSFSYDQTAAPALDGVTLALKTGGTLGVIGGTGSGKSTLVKLLPRLYDVTAGSVGIFGTDVRDYPLVQLRALVSVVPQDVSLVSGTVRSNLLWRNDTASDEELWAALDTAQAADFVRALSQGLDAPVEAGGRNFSGGQRQRLTIARALVGRPRMIVLDDAASALDYATDARLRTALYAKRSELTSVIVSQRVAAVRDADKILVLDHGRVAGLGTHDELLKTCMLYREICASQLDREERGETQHG